MNRAALLLAAGALAVAALNCGDDEGTASTDAGGSASTVTTGGAGGNGGGEGGTSSTGGTGGASETFTVGGVVTGLVGTLTLANGSDTMTLAADGDFIFDAPVADGAGFDVTVDTDPKLQRCSVTGGTGTVNGGNVASVTVTCTERYALFMANDGQHGVEPWYSDGTESGTLRLGDLNPVGDTYIGPVARMGDAFYFMGTPDGSGVYLWRTDLTNTSLVKAFATGEPKAIVVLGDTLIFQATGADGQELYRSDGTDTGTMLVKDIHPAGSSSPNKLAVAAGRVFFSADDGTHGREPWVTDGSEAGTLRVADIDGAGDSNPSRFVGIGANVFFGAQDGTTTNLYVTDGTPGGTLNLTQFVSGAVLVPSFADLGGSLVFVAQNNLAETPHITDGTQAGTDSIRDLGIAMAPLGDMNQAGDQAFFSCPIESGTDYDLCVTDGTFNGTLRIKEIAPSGDSFFYSNTFTTVGDRVFFGASDGVHGMELWVSDGTDAGTQLVEDIDTTGDGFRGPLGVIGDNTLLFAAWTDDESVELWRSDGASANTELVKAICPGTCSSLELD